MEDAETKVARWAEAPPLKTSRELKLRVDEDMKRDVEILEKRGRSTREDFSQVFSQVAPRRPNTPEGFHHRVDCCNAQSAAADGTTFSDSLLMTALSLPPGGRHSAQGSCTVSAAHIITEQEGGGAPQQPG